MSQRIQAIYYDEPEGGIYSILAPEINGEEYVKKLNERAEEFNKLVEVLEEKETELNSIYNYYASFEEVTGVERLNEREPKYPPQTPKGFKSVILAFPEIGEERERRRLHNEKYRKIHHEYMDKIKEQIKVDLKPLRDELLEKYPEFKSFVKSYFSFERKIYYKFVLDDYNYITEDLK